MADKLATLSVSISDFFLRCGLDPRQARCDCHAYIEERFPGGPITPTLTQGYCSYTVSIEDRIVQFRSPNYKLDIAVASAARDVYGAFAPETAYLGTLDPHGLHIYSMSKMPGVSYKSFATQEHTQASSMRKILCEDFATFLAKAWYRRPKNNLPLGTIGSSIPSRLSLLSSSIPPRFRLIVKNLISQYHVIESLPIVLAHGDVVSSNILLDPSTGHLAGLVDWAEAELLPFGICLYGLEELLGRITTVHNNPPSLTPSLQFVYYPDAEQARAAFWSKLCSEIPQLADEGTLHAVLLARDLGIMLWHGFAFDDGAINRVVQEGRDAREICYLDTLLSGTPAKHLNNIPPFPVFNKLAFKQTTQFEFGARALMS